MEHPLTESQINELLNKMAFIDAIPDGKTRSNLYTNLNNNILKISKYSCECGGVFDKTNKRSHEKTKKHQKYLEHLNKTI